MIMPPRLIVKCRANIGPASLNHVAVLDAPGKLEGCPLFHVADERSAIRIPGVAASYFFRNAS